MADVKAEVMWAMREEKWALVLVLASGIRNGWLPIRDTQSGES